MTQRDYKNQMNTWSQANTRHSIESNLEGAIQKLILKTVDFLHYAQHYHYLTKLAGVLSETIINTLKVEYQAEYEDKKAIKKQLDEDWDPNTGMETLYLKHTVLHQELADMKLLPAYDEEEWSY